MECKSFRNEKFFRNKIHLHCYKDLSWKLEKIKQINFILLKTDFFKHIQIVDKSNDGSIKTSV